MIEEMGTTIMENSMKEIPQFNMAERQAWVQFVCAVLTTGEFIPEEAAIVADEMMAEYQKRKSSENVDITFPGGHVISFKATADIFRPQVLDNMDEDIGGKSTEVEPGGHRI